MVESAYPMALVYHSKQDKLQLLISSVDWIPSGGRISSAVNYKKWTSCTKLISEPPMSVVNMMTTTAGQRPARRRCIQGGYFVAATLWPSTEIQHFLLC